MIKNGELFCGKFGSTERAGFLAYVLSNGAANAVEVKR